MAHIQYVDGLVREYMLFRGFSNSMKIFDQELKNEKDKTFRADKIIDQITTLVNCQDLQSLRELWTNLDNHLFSKLEHSFAAAVRKLECGLLKLYLITAYGANKSDKVSDFFMKLSSELQQQTEWKEWFYFPFCKNPEEHPSFAVYFTKQWQDTFLISLHNFLSTIFQCIPQPTLSRIENETNLIKKLQEENLTLRNRLQNVPSVNPLNSNVAANTQNALNELQKRGRTNTTSIQNLNDIISFDISPPGHIVDDFYIIAAETVNVSQMTDSQSRSLKSLIRNIGTSGSPVMGRKESLDRSKRRSGSVGRNWV